MQKLKQIFTRKSQAKQLPAGEEDQLRDSDHLEASESFSMLHSVDV